MSKVIKVNEEGLDFDCGSEVYSYHNTDCCEHHWLSFKDLSLSDFYGLEFDLSSDSFFERVEGFGIRLLPTNGHPIPVPGYGDNNGYYSSDLDIVVIRNGEQRHYDISECQGY